MDNDVGGGGGGDGDGAGADSLPLQQQRGGRGTRRGGRGRGPEGQQGGRRRGVTAARGRDSSAPPRGGGAGAGRGRGRGRGSVRAWSEASSSESSEQDSARKACEALYEEVKAKLQDKVYSLGPRAGFSGVWDHYFVVFDEVGNEVGVSSCRVCQKFYKFGGSNGTSGMTKHTPKCKPTARLAPPPAAKARAKQAVIKWVAETMKVE